MTKTAPDPGVASPNYDPLTGACNKSRTPSGMGGWSHRGNTADCTYL